MREFRKIVSVLGLIVVIIYQLSTIYYSHFHVVNGTIIVHFHSLEGSERNSHTHTPEEIAKINLLFHYVNTTLIEKIAIVAFFALTQIIISKSVTSQSFIIFIKTSLRGPPSSCYSISTI
jgi:hypothetical protein